MRAAFSSRPTKARQNFHFKFAQQVRATQAFSKASQSVPLVSRLGIFSVRTAMADYDGLLAKVREKIRSAEAKLERQLKDGTASSECNEEMLSCEKNHTQCPCHLNGFRDPSLGWAAYCHLRREIGKLKCDEAALVEERRAERLVSEYYEEHPNAHNYKLECPTCMGIVPLTANITMLSCCGKIICYQCSHELFVKAKSNDCPFCRTPTNEESRDLFEEHVADGKPWALWQKANDYLQKGKAKKALGPLHRAFDGHFNRAAESLAMAYFEIVRQQKSGGNCYETRRTALLWASRAVNDGSIGSAGFIAAMMSDNDAEAVKLMSIAAHIGWTSAQVMLGHWYYEGERGLEKSLELAKYWSEKAISNGGDGLYDLAHATWNLAQQWYGGCSGYTGHEVRGECFDLFRKSAELGHRGALIQMQKMAESKGQRCSNASCGKNKNDCKGNNLPIWCMRCSFERYCSLQCLASDWKVRHKDDCRPWKSS